MWYKVGGQLIFAKIRSVLRLVPVQGLSQVTAGQHCKSMKSYTQSVWHDIHPTVVFLQNT